MPPNPVDDEELYNVIELEGIESPGLVKLSGHNRKVNWDVKAGNGQTGATTTLKDVPPIEFTATFTLADKNDFDGWQEFADIIESSVSGANPKALDIYHPDLASQKPPIESVVKAEIGGVVHDGLGGQSIAVKFQEYRAPKAKGGSPSGSKAKATADPDADALAELQKLVDQYNNVPPALIPHPEQEH